MPANIAIMSSIMFVPLENLMYLNPVCYDDDANKYVGLTWRGIKRVKHLKMQMKFVDDIP